MDSDGSSSEDDKKSAPKNDKNDKTKSSSPPQTVTNGASLSLKGILKPNKNTTESENNEINSNVDNDDKKQNMHKVAMFSF